MREKRRQLTGRIFSSHEEAERYNTEQMARMSPQERLDMVSTLRNQYSEIYLGRKPGLHRVYRVLQSGRG